MAKYFLIFFGLALLFCTSCISHKDVLYFQENETASDSILQLNQQQKPYRIQINDILSIKIKVLDQENVSIFNPLGDGELGASSQENAYFNGFTVDLQGNITIPQLGDFKVLSLDTKEIEALVKERLLKEQFNEFASIFVTVRLAGLRYTTLGEIGNGPQTLFKERATIFEAIANAGDISEFGNRKDVLIIRQYPHGQEIHNIDLTQRNVMQSPYYYILPNDMIYVQPLKQKTIGLGANNIQTVTTLIGIVTVITSTVLLLSR